MKIKMTHRTERTILTGRNGTTIIERVIDTHGNETTRSHLHSHSVFPEYGLSQSSSIIPNEWLQNVIPAMNNDQIQEAFGFALPEEIINMLTHNFGQYVEEQRAPPSMLTKAQFSTLPSRRFSKKKNPNRYHSIECSICQSNYKSKEKLIKLPCGHEYHQNATF